MDPTQALTDALRALREADNAADRAIAAHDERRNHDEACATQNARLRTNDAAKAFRNLADWLDSGGFRPDVGAVTGILACGKEMGQ